MEEELERLSSETFYNPFDVLYLGMEATDEDIKKMYRSFSLLLHPDKCKDPRGKDCW
jgi:DnaJ family protein C protein 8